jgi:hypothetical protein
MKKKDKKVEEKPIPVQEKPHETKISEEKVPIDTLTIEKEETPQPYEVQPYEVKEMPKVVPSEEAIPSFIEFGGLSRKERVECELEMLEAITKKIQNMLFMINSAAISNFQEDYEIYPDVSDFISRARKTLEKQNPTIFELMSALDDIIYAIMHTTQDLLEEIKD